MERKSRARKSPPAPDAPVRDIMDIKALADYLSLGKSKIYALIRQKKIPASRIGRQYRFSRVVIDQWLNEKLITAKDESQMPLFGRPSKSETGENP